MSSRIEKGGARFKPSIVPRRSAAGTPAANRATPSSSTAPSPSPSQQPPSSASTAATAIPNTAAVAPARKPQPITPRRNVPITPTQQDASSGPSRLATTGSSQSYAFSLPAAVINKTQASPSARTSMTAGQASASTASGAKPVFRRPSVSKPRPGSRTSLTPAPSSSQPASARIAQQPPSSSSHRAAPTIDEGQGGEEAAEAASVSTRSDAPPSIGGSRSSRRDNASAIRVGAARSSDNASAGSSAQAQQEEQIAIDKASQPDPPQAPAPATRPRSATSTSARSKAPIKQSASQVENAQPTPIAPASVSSSNAKGKARQIADDSTAQNTSTVANPSQEETQEKATRAAAVRRRSAAERLQKRRLKRKERASGKPSRPLSAYLLFVNSVRADRQSANPDMSLTELTSAIAADWRELPPAQRTRWEADAALLRQQYDAALESWKLAHPDGVQLGPEDESDMETTSELDEHGAPIRRKKRRVTAARQPHTVSDDEEEYRRQVYQEGAQLAASRLDPANVSMADISTAEYKMGRAGPRTFEAERVYKRMVTDRRAAARSALLGGHVLGDKLDAASPSPAPAAAAAGRIVRTANGAPVEDGAEEVLDGEEEEEAVDSRTENDDDDEQDEDSELDEAAARRRKREASVAATDVSFRENRFAVQTRIVDGKIVLDETSLFANFGNDEDRDNMEVVDEREGDRFVNAATYSRKLGRNRKWTADETAKFYRALQQWGTDFEMIARLFPGRDRVMIKKKFNVEERSNAKLVDEALRNTVPVNLEAYAQAIGVDLSGPPPEIKADLQDIASLAQPEAGIKKREGTAPLAGKKGGGRSDAEDDAEDDDDGYEYEEVVEVDDEGNEQVIRRRLGRKPGSRGAAKKRRNSARKNSVSTPAPAAAQSGLAGPNADGDAVMDAAASAAADGGRSGGPPSIGSRRGTRTTRNRAGSTREAPGDGREVEEIIGEA